jgi:putative ABC transport system permease protein
VALAVVLLTSGGLLLQTFQRLANTDLGLRAEKLLTFEMPLFRYDDFPRRVAFLNAQLERIRALPGVLDAGAISRLPLTPADHATFYLLPGQTEANIVGQVALIRVVTSGYFSTIGARLREGRFFETSDLRSASPVAIVNESFASRNFPGRSPLGERLKIGQLDEKGYWYTIVGVVERLREVTIAEEPRPAVYLLHEQNQFGTKGAGPSWIVVRTGGEPASNVPPIRQAIRSMDKNQPIWRVETLEEIVDRQLSTPRQTASLMSAFALLALILAALGIYGVLSYAVTQRTNEIGVRMALGASSGDILLAFGKRGLALTLSGLAIGLGLAAIASRSMSALLYGFRPDYAATVTVVSLVLLAVSAMACLVPARRASRVDPVVALRNE